MAGPSSSFFFFFFCFFLFFFFFLSSATAGLLPLLSFHSAVTNVARSLPPVARSTTLITPSVASISRSTHPLSPFLSFFFFFFSFRRLLTPIDRRHAGQIRPCFPLPRSLRRGRGIASCMSARGSQVCSFSAQRGWVRWSRFRAGLTGPFNSAGGHPGDFEVLCGSGSETVQREIVKQCGKDSKDALGSYKESCGEAGFKISMCIPRRHITTLRREN